MEFSLPIFIKIAAAMAALYLAAGLFAEVQWRIRLRLTIAFSVGAVIIGMLPWGFAKPDDPLMPFSILTSGINFQNILLLILLLAVSVVITYFLCRPYSFEFACVTIPAGIGVWTFRSGEMANILQGFSKVSDRVQIYSAMRWGVLLWLGFILLGIIIALLLKKITTGKVNLQEFGISKTSITSIILAVVFSVIISNFLIGIFARDVSLFDSKTGSVVAQPPNIQIAFALILSFGITAYLTKFYLDVNYIWIIFSAAALLFITYTKYANSDEIVYITNTFPAVFFPGSVKSILPIQMMIFSTMGAGGGYWMAVRYKLWKDEQN
jgi:hypothetical protein